MKGQYQYAYMVTPPKAVRILLYYYSTVYTVFSTVRGNSEQVYYNKGKL